MTAWCAAVAIVAVSVMVARPAAAEDEPPDRTWDLQLTAGIGGGWRDADASVRGLLRMRAGGVFGGDTLLFAAGAAGQVGGAGRPAAGVELEVFESDLAVWGRLDALVGLDDVVIAGAAGFAFFGVEYQRRVNGSHDQAVLFTVDVPLGITRMYLDRNSPVLIHGLK